MAMGDGPGGVGVDWQHKLLMGGWADGGRGGCRKRGQKLQMPKNKQQQQ